MKNQILSFFLLGLVTFGLYGCLSSVTPTQISRFPWVTQWLKQSSCQPPCFMNLIPGETPFMDVPRILGNFPDVIEVRGPKNWGQEQCFDWDMSGCGTATFGLACIKDKDKKNISHISLGFDCNPGASFVLKEIIQIFGAPDYVYSKPFVNVCAAHLFFVNKGMLVSTGSSPLGKTMKISPDWGASRIYLFKKSGDLQSTLISLGWYQEYSMERMVEWKGYTEYPCMQWK